MPNQSKPLIGVSRCLLGDAVRYDGASRPCGIITEKLSALFELVAVCPEVEAGLPVPRPPVQLTATADNFDKPRLTGRYDPALDATDALQRFCLRRVPLLDQLTGFIFKSRSPSCALASAPLFIDGTCVTDTADGLFTTALLQAYPHLAVIDDRALQNPDALQRFIHAVMQQPA